MQTTGIESFQDTRWDISGMFSQQTPKQTQYMWRHYVSHFGVSLKEMEEVAGESEV